MLEKRIHNFFDASVQQRRKVMKKVQEKPSRKNLWRTLRILEIKKDDLRIFMAFSVQFLLYIDATDWKNRKECSVLKLSDPRIKNC